MKSLKYRINEKRSAADEEEIQQYIDIISMNPKKYSKYIDILKSKFGIDFYDRFNDDEYIHSASLKDIKKKVDFANFDNYIKYALKIFKLRNLADQKHIDKVYQNKDVVVLGKEFGFKVELKEYSGAGNYASFDMSDNTITTPSEVDVNTLIHEIGHWFDQTYSKGYEGLAKTITHASSVYGIRLNAEVFAENFMHYFIAPKFLKSKLPEVYNELDKRIPTKIKKTIGGLI